MASLTLDSLQKQFGTVWAVRNVNLDISNGEFIALLGPSGCGKTTTLRMVAGLEMPTFGTIDIDGRNVTQLPPRDRNIAMVFQDYALYPHMTVLENVGYPLKVRSVPSGQLRERVQAVAEQLQIGMLLDRRPGQLSGGQQQRVALARAVVHHAEVTLYDEPLSNLDTKLRLEARAFLKHLQREVGSTSVYVTHDQAEAMALADRIVVMNQGEIMQVGTPHEIYRTPANTFVASFIGSPPMNLLPCEIERDRIRLASGDSLPVTADTPSAGVTTLGIRPEHITLHLQPVPETIPGEVYVTQMLGSETIVMIKLGGELISVRLFTDEAPPIKQALWLEFSPLHLFFYNAEGNLIA